MKDAGVNVDYTGWGTIGAVLVAFAAFWRTRKRENQFDLRQDHAALLEEMHRIADKRATEIVEARITAERETQRRDLALTIRAELAEFRIQIFDWLEQAMRHSRAASGE